MWTCIYPGESNAHITFGKDRVGDMFFKLIQMVCILVAAGVLGNWYLSEYRRVKAMDLPWYRAYLTLPAILIIAMVILLPLLARHI